VEDEEKEEKVEDEEKEDEKKESRVSPFATGPLSQKIWEENMFFLGDFHTFDFHYLTFMWNFVQIEHPVDGKAVTWEDRVGQADIAMICTDYTFKLFVRGVDVASFPQWIALLKTIYSGSVTARRRFLNELRRRTEWVQSILFHCPFSHQAVRHAFVDLIIHVIRSHHTDRELYFDYEPEAEKIDEKAAIDKLPTSPSGSSVSSNGSSSSGSKPSPPSSNPPYINELRNWKDRESRSECIGFIISMLKLLPTVRHHWREDYFRLLLEFARIGAEEQRWMISYGVISRLIDFYNDPEPLFGFNQRQAYPSGKNVRIHPPGCQNMMDLLALLVTHGETNKRKNLFPLYDGDRKRLDHKQSGGFIYSWMIKDTSHIEHMISILSHWSYGDPEFARYAIDLALQNIDSEIQAQSADPYRITEYRPYFRLLSSIISQESSEKEKGDNVEYALPKLIKMLKNHLTTHKSGDERFLYFASKYLLMLSLRDEEVQKFMRKYQRDWSTWVEDYVRSRQAIITRQEQARS